MVPDWVVIVAYILFCVGGVLLIACLVRILWYCCIVRKQQRKDMKHFYDNPNYFSSHHQDPWLKDNELMKRRLEGDPDYDEFKDINISEFMHRHADTSAKDLSSDLYATLSRRDQERTHIDSQSVEIQAKYEEPNTNLILARKECHVPPENMDISLYDSDTALVAATSVATESYPASQSSHNDDDDDHVVELTSQPANGPLMSRSEETLQVLSVLDLAMAEEDLDSSRDNFSIPPTPHTPHPFAATANEPLPMDSEMDYVMTSTMHVGQDGEILTSL